MELGSTWDVFVNTATLEVIFRRKGATVNEEDLIGTLTSVSSTYCTVQFGGPGAVRFGVNLDFITFKMGYGITLDDTTGRLSNNYTGYSTLIGKTLANGNMLRFRVGFDEGEGWICAGFIESDDINNVLLNSVISNQTRSVCSMSTLLKFDIEGKSCKGCSVECKVCLDKTNTQCSICNSGYYLQPSSTICRSTCPLGYWADEKTGICRKCDSRCSQCSGPTSSECSACSVGFYFFPNTTSCITTCPTRFSKSESERLCVKCPDFCTTCTVCPTCADPFRIKCTLCEANYFYITAENHCDSCTRSGYFKDGSLCKPCHPSCSTCRDATNQGCLSCDQNTSTYLLASNQSCVACNEQNYFKNKALGTCGRCDPSCETCTGSSPEQCITCKKEFYTLDNAHLCTSCSMQGFFTNGAHCSSCHPHCKSCWDSSQFSCLSCSDGLLYDPFDLSCVTSCPTPLTLDVNENRCVFDSDSILNFESYVTRVISSGKGMSLRSHAQFILNLAEQLAKLEEKWILEGSSPCPSCSGNGQCLYDKIYAQNTCECTADWVLPTCSLTRSDALMIERIRINIIETIKNVTLKFTDDKSSEVYLQALIILSKNDYRGDNQVLQTLSKIVDIIEDDYSSTSAIVDFDRTKLQLALTLTGSLIEQAHSKDCFFQLKTWRGFYTDALNAVLKIGALQLRTKPTGGPNYAIQSSNLELVSKRVTLNPKNPTPRVSIRRVDGTTTVTLSNSSEVPEYTFDVHAIFWNSDLFSCPIMRKRSNNLGPVTLNVVTEDSIIESPSENFFSATVSYSSSDSAGACGIQCTGESNIQTGLWTCTCPKAIRINLYRKLSHAFDASAQWIAEANAVPDIVSRLSSWAFWMLIALALWFGASQGMILLRIHSPNRFVLTPEQRMNLSIKETELDLPLVELICWGFVVRTVSSKPHYILTTTHPSTDTPLCPSISIKTPYI